MLRLLPIFLLAYLLFPAAPQTPTGGPPASTGGDGVRLPSHRRLQRATTSDCRPARRQPSVASIPTRWSPASTRDGSPDPGFGGGEGVAAIESDSSESANAVALQPDGKIVVAGATTTGKNGIVYRLNPDGSPDKGFGTEGAAPVDSGGYETLLRRCHPTRRQDRRRRPHERRQDLAILPADAARQARHQLRRRRRARHRCGRRRGRSTRLCSRPTARSCRRLHHRRHRAPPSGRAVHRGRRAGHDVRTRRMAHAPTHRSPLRRRRPARRAHPRCRLRPERRRRPPTAWTTGLPDKSFGDNGTVPARQRRPRAGVLAGAPSRQRDRRRRRDGRGLRRRRVAADREGIRDRGFGDRRRSSSSRRPGFTHVDGHRRPAGPQDRAGRRHKGASNRRRPHLPLLGDSRSSSSPGRRRRQAPAKAVRCAGRKATIVGTARRDFLRGTRRRDVIAALGGTRRARAGGDDVICGGGRDRLLGGAGGSSRRARPDRPRGDQAGSGNSSRPRSAASRTMASWSSLRSNSAGV